MICISDTGLHGSELLLTWQYLETFCPAALGMRSGEGMGSKKGEEKEKCGRDRKEETKRKKGWILR